MRRCLNDPWLSWATAYAPAVRHVLRLNHAKRLRVIIDESGHTDAVRVLVASVWYRNRAIPLAWVPWPAQTPQERSYWAKVDDLLALLKQVVPAELPITVLADRAFGHPTFTDRITALGWQYVVRIQGQTRYRDRQGQLQTVRSLVTHTQRRWKGQGELFKDAGWRTVSIVAFWSKQHREPLLLASSLPLGWDVIAEYKRRSAIEALFRDYKSKGWQWEASQVYDVEHHERLLLGLAWATLLVLLLGEEQIQAILAQPGPKVLTRTWEGKHSVFRLGKDRLRARLAGTVQGPIVWQLAAFDAGGWQQECRQHHALAGTTLRAA